MHKKNIFKLTLLSFSVICLSVSGANAATSNSNTTPKNTSFFKLTPLSQYLFSDTPSEKNIYLYNTDNTQLSVGGEFDAQIAKAPPSSGTPQRTQLQNAGTDIEINAANLISKKYKLSVIAQAEIGFGNASGLPNDVVRNGSGGWNNPSMGSLFGGFYTPTYGQLTFGSQDTTGDFVKISSFTESWTQIDPLNEFATQTLVYHSPTVNGFNMIANYTFGHSKVKNYVNGKLVSNNADGYGLGVFYNGNITKKVSYQFCLAYGELFNTALRAGQTAVNTTTGTGYGTQYAGMGSATITFNKFTLGASYAVLRAQSGYVINNGATAAALGNGFINSLGFQNRFNAYQLGVQYQYGKASTAYIWAEYDNYRTTPSDVASAVTTPATGTLGKPGYKPAVTTKNPGQQRSQVGDIGIQFLLNPQLPNLFMWVEGAMWFNKTNTTSTREKGVAVGLQYNF